ncbi:endolytic transglycosylase MltG [Streptomyces sp. NBC_01754]|uniref:endolytic transglycosylase MltG n=1 Tax=Streptomyces sp. NBC_01754 TaxID=2975930 RepID=UPI002DDA21A0|nr:endolytic transglycosylase MltG [Streptomyces sp. NBC_01754]WSC91484.1 endolytic transglycosylase MltG [Streptomyces sp. NBC_01754]
MTEYGRGPGSEPWHPEDPLYGDQGWGGHEAAQGHGQGQGQYEGQQQPYAQDPYAPQGYPQDPYAQQQHQQDPYAQQHQQQYGNPQDPYAQQHQQPQQYYGNPQDPYAQQPHPRSQPQYDGGWDTGGQSTMPYAPQAASYDPGPGGYGEQPDYYGTPEAYPPPQPPGHRAQHPEPEPEPERQSEPSHQNPDWDPDAPQEETHPFFTGADEPADDRDTRSRSRRDDEDEDHEDGSRASRRGGERRGKGKKKSRNGCACLGVAAVLAGGLGGVVYLGYTYYQDRFGSAPDYAGGGSGSVEVEIPEGAYGNEIANILKKAGVVKSTDAFISAQNGNPQGKSLQAGVYLLKKEMSAKSAVELMLNPKSQNGLIIPEGTSTTGVYVAIDKQLELKEGTTAEVARTKAESLGLPEWAGNDPKIKDPLEGFLFPAAYPVAKGSKPEDALKKMVARANKEYAKLDLEKSAANLNLKSPLELLTVASLVQKEGKYKHDFDKVSRVVYNRLKPDNTQTAGRLEFDSTVNYIRQESTLDIGPVDEVRKIDDPYNTYSIKGLPLGPITNPGIDALQSAIKPADGPWYYFVSINEDKTLFAVTNDEHNRNRAEYEKQQKARQ